MVPCRHGFDPEVGPGWWCIACDVEEASFRSTWPWVVVVLPVLILLVVIAVVAIVYH